MGTNNFTTQKDFDLYVAVYDYPDEEEAKKAWIEYKKDYYGEYDEEDFNYDNWVDNDAEWYYDSEYANLKWLADEVNDKLNYFKITLESGYYDGIQTLIEPQDYWSVLSYKNFEDFELDNEDSNYYFGDYRSVTLRKIRAEINKINKKYLPYMKNNSSLERIIKIGQFSNGEAVYQRVA